MMFKCPWYLPCWFQFKEPWATTTKLLVSAVLASKFHVSHWHSRIFDRHLEELHQLASGIITCWFCFNAVPLNVQDRKMPRLTPCTRHPRTKHTWRTFLEVCHEQLAHSRHTDTVSHTVSHTTDWFKDGFAGTDGSKLKIHPAFNCKCSFAARDAQKLPRQSPLAPCVV